MAPIPASSGEVHRMRLNRVGNRRLNRALYTIALSQAFGTPVFSSGPGVWENLGKEVLSDQPIDLADVWGDASRVVLVGSDRGLDQLCHAAAWWSADGRSWQGASIDPPGRGLGYVSTAPGGVVVQGVTGSCDGGATPAALWFSPDGVAFRQVPVVIPDGWCLPRGYSDLCLSGDRAHVVIVGPSGDALISEDGSSWWRAGGSIAGSSTLDPTAQGFAQLAVGQLGIVASCNRRQATSRSGTGRRTLGRGRFRKGMSPMTGPASRGPSVDAAFDPRPRLRADRGGGSLILGRLPMVAAGALEHHVRASFMDTALAPLEY